MQSPSQQGLVLRIDAKVCHVEVDGERLQLPLAGKLFEAKSHEKRPLAVGDRVVLDATGKAIDVVLPRTSQLHRRAASEGEERAQVIAANITHVLVVASVASPPFQPEMVDGVIAAAAREKIPTTIVLAKVDLDAELAVKWAAVYGRAQVRVLATSTLVGCLTKETLREVEQLLHSNRTVLVGLSGAGKSSLLNAVLPGLTLLTGTLNHIRQGRHTTTHTQLLPLPGGGHVLDTPGVRNFHLFCVGSQELQFLFAEIGALLPMCGYRSCLHDGEGECAVQAAVSRGEIAASRYRSYRTMLNEAVASERPESREAKAPVRGGSRRRPRR